MMPRCILQPWLYRCGKAAGERQTIHSEGNKSLSERINVPAGEPEEFERRGVIGRSMFDNRRCERCEIPGQRAGHPTHDGMRV